MDGMKLTPYDDLLRELIENQIEKCDYFPEELGPPCLDWAQRHAQKFDPAKGTRARAYFNVVVRCWLMGAKKAKKRAERAKETS